MKIKKSHRAAFFNLRALIASLLCLTAGMLTLFALAGAQQPANNTQTTSSSRWLTRLASTLGIESLTQRFAGGGAIKLDKDPADRTQALLPAAVPYSGPPRDLRPVVAVRSGKLRDLAPIDPATVTKNPVPEPIRPKPPTKSGGPNGPIQRKAGIADIGADSDRRQLRGRRCGTRWIQPFQ